MGRSRLAGLEFVTLPVERFDAALLLGCLLFARLAHLLLLELVFSCAIHLAQDAAQRGQRVEMVAGSVVRSVGHQYTLVVLFAAWNRVAAHCADADRDAGLERAQPVLAIVDQGVAVDFGAARPRDPQIAEFLNERGFVASSCAARSARAGAVPPAHADAAHCVRHRRPPGPARPGRRT
jgi:hypothetical protein